MHFETLAIQSTQLSNEDTRAVSTPIFMSTTFERAADGSYPSGYVYSRMDNPNRQLLEKSIALLEKGGVGLAFASGMAATTAVFQTLPPGSHLILPHDAYYTTNDLAKTIFGSKGIKISEVNMTRLEEIQEAIRPETALIWLETPSNPQLSISDIEEIAKMAHAVGALCAVDNTWPTPVLQRPLELGADIVMHSTTKYFGGHSDVLGGCLVLKEEGELSEQIRKIQAVTGGVPSPFECWLTTRGIKTLYLRVQAQTRTAGELAAFLAQHPKIEQVNYPGLTAHPQHEIAKKQMPGGFGAMLSVQVKGSAAEAMALTGRLQLFTTATSLGGVESLIEHRKSVEGPASPTPDNLLRLSIGLENIEDLKADWEQALAG
ncbi:MAG: aminotransferase class V-fold PLP-dependent enzyme [Saprospiraceae bacterium]|nr:aminotransferase class V-fold PLP-dependent enzyme [Saprospiraceae bacterium]